ncbi:MAG: AAA family ATPase [Lachnospiraceae bacterium]
MSNITVKMFGEFEASVDGIPVSFPYKKVEALFCYLIMKRRVTRDELSNLFWLDKDESTAKKNLRNAIYKLKKCFINIDNLLDITQSVITWGTNISITCDVEIFLKNLFEIDNYRGAFLENYSVKEADSFETWVLEVRDQLKTTYLARLSEQIEMEKNNHNLEKVEKYCKLAIRTDEFDESAYRNLLDCYKNQEKFNSGLELYDELSELLEKELSITPEIETEEVFSGFLQEMHARHKGQGKNTFFYGRQMELRIIDENCENFLEGIGANSILIKGEMGIGKTWLKDKLISNNFEWEDIYIFETVCYQFEKEHLMKTWKNIVLYLLQTIQQDNIELPFNMNKFFYLYHSGEQENKKILKDINPEDLIDLLRGDVFEDLITALLKIISTKKKMILVFEDIHWMDADSMSALVKMLSRIDQQKIMFVLTCRNEDIDSLKKLYVFVEHSEKMQTIYLNRYNKKEVENFINKALPGYIITNEVMDKIYIETEGNTFFLAEYLNVLNSKKDINIMTAKMHNIIESKFLDMSKEEKKISEITSLFDDGAPIYIFKKLLQMDELEIIDLIENLENRFILEEISNNEVLCVKFTHRKLREFQYRSLSNMRRSVLHNKVAQILEECLGNAAKDLNLYYQIAYHLKNADNIIGFLKYKIKILNVNLDFSHERFPILHFENKIYNQFDFDEKRTKKEIDEIETMLDKVKYNNTESMEILNLEMSLLHIKGRYMIRRGIYEEGLKCIKSMMEIAQELCNVYYLAEGCKQIILHCIQTDNADIMRKYINYGYELAKEQKSPINHAIFIRYDAVHKIMMGDMETAECLLKECIELLSQSTRSVGQYILHIAACYDELGEIYKNRRELVTALGYYEKAIELCEKNNVWISISLFHTHAGEIAYWLEDYETAEKYLKKALAVYHRIEYNAGQALAEAYMVLLLLREKNCKLAAQYLLKAEVNANKLKIPIELETVLRVKQEFENQIKNNPEFKEKSRQY